MIPRKSLSLWGDRSLPNWRPNLSLKLWIWVCKDCSIIWLFRLLLFGSSNSRPFTLFLMPCRGSHGTLKGQPWRHMKVPPWWLPTFRAIPLPQRFKFFSWPFPRDKCCIVRRTGLWRITIIFCWKYRSQPFLTNQWPFWRLPGCYSSCRSPTFCSICRSLRPRIYHRRAIWIPCEPE